MSIPEQVAKEMRQERHNLARNLPEGEVADPEREIRQAQNLANSLPESETPTSGIDAEKAESNHQELSNEIHSQEPAGRLPDDSV